MFTLNTTCKFVQGDSFETFISQFQSKSDQLICLINNTLMFYDYYEDIPKNLQFSHRHEQIYYLKNKKNSYCVFNREAANIMCPNLNEVDYSSVMLSNKFKFRNKIKPVYKTSVMTTKVPNQIMITDQGVKHMFENYNFPVIIYSYE